MYLNNFLNSTRNLSVSNQQKKHIDEKHGTTPRLLSQNHEHCDLYFWVVWGDFFPGLWKFEISKLKYENCFEIARFLRDISIKISSIKWIHLTQFKNKKTASKKSCNTFFCFWSTPDETPIKLKIKNYLILYYKPLLYTTSSM